MLRKLAPFLMVLAFFATAGRAMAQADQRQLVSQAASTIERLKTDHNFQQSFVPRLGKARGVLIIPSLYKGGFMLGAQYGNGVLLARGAQGWSYPAFYTVTGGSFGLQIGVESASITFLIMSDKGMRAVMSNQFKIGADAGLTVAVIGAGMGAATTPNLSADILAFSLGGVGLYGGISLEGTVISPRETWNAAYYGRNVATGAVIYDRAVSNPQADKLRDILSH